MSSLNVKVKTKCSVIYVNILVLMYFEHQELTDRTAFDHDTAWSEQRYASPLTYCVGVCKTVLLSHTPMCVASDLSVCLTTVFRGIQTFVRPTTSWPPDSNPQQNIKHHSISLLGSVSHNQIKGTTMFLFQLIWKCHIISKRTSVLFMSNIFLVLTSQHRPGRAPLTKQKAKGA